MDEAFAKKVDGLMQRMTSEQRATVQKALLIGHLVLQAMVNASAGVSE